MLFHQIMTILCNKYSKFLILTKENNSQKRRSKPVGSTRNPVKPKYTPCILPEPEIRPTRILPKLEDT